MAGAVEAGFIEVETVKTAHGPRVIDDCPHCLSMKMQFMQDWIKAGEDYAIGGYYDGPQFSLTFFEGDSGEGEL